MMLFRSSCGRRAREPVFSISRAITTNSCAVTTAPISAVSNWRRVRSMRASMAGVTLSFTEIFSTSWSRSRADGQPDFQRLPAHSGCALLVALEMGQAEGEECGQLHRRVRESVGDGGQTSSGRRSDLRPYSHGGYPRRLRSSLHQLRRLGRELYGRGRAPRWWFRDYH